MMRPTIVLFLVLMTATIASPDTGRRTLPRPVRVGYLKIDPFHPVEGKNRLEKLGVELVELTTGDLPKGLSKCDVLFLPTQWAESDRVRTTLRTHRAAVREFVDKGGAIYVAQPNINGDIDELPLTFTVAKDYDRDDATERVSSLLAGLPDEELPFPADTILDHDERFEVAALGSSSGNPALLVAPFGRGRIAVCLTNENNLDRRKAAVTTCSMSDACLRRILEWLVRRPIPVKR